MFDNANLLARNRYTNAIRMVFFLAGISNFIRIQTNVQIIPTEILAVILSLYSFLQRRNNTITIHDIRILKYLNIFFVVSFLNQVLVDQIQKAILSETLKSVAQTIVLWSLLRVAIMYMKSDVFRFISYVSGFLLSNLLQLIFDPSPYMQVDPWKFALGPAITGAFFLLYKSGNPSKGRSFFLIVLIVIDIYLGSRSLALFTLLALVITSKKDRVTKSSFARYLAVALTFVILLFGVERIYYQLSTAGTLGISQQIKSLDQYKAGPILVAGRSELAFQVSAIIQNPFLGNGSNPDLTYEVLNRAQEINSSLGVKTEITNAYKSSLHDGKVPQHSMLLGAWVEGGILSFIFWAILFIWTAKRFIVMPKRLPPLGYFTTYVALSTLWAIVFSPLGAGSRMELVIGLAALLLQSKIGDNANQN